MRSSRFEKISRFLALEREPVVLLFYYLFTSCHQEEKSKLTFNFSNPIMSNEQKESIWSTVLRVVITILTAIATSLGVQSCM